MNSVICADPGTKPSRYQGHSISYRVCLGVVSLVLGHRVLLQCLGPNSKAQMHRTLLSASLVTFKPLHSGKGYTQTGSLLSLSDSDFCHPHPHPLPQPAERKAAISHTKKNLKQALLFNSFTALLVTRSE